MSFRACGEKTQQAQISHRSVGACGLAERAEATPVDLSPCGIGRYTRLARTDVEKKADHADTWMHLKPCTHYR